MNKLFKISLLSLLAIPVLAGCGKNSVDPKVKAAAQEAFTQIGVAYAGYASSDGLGIAGGALITEYKTESGYEFTFKYTVSPMKGKTYDVEYVKINSELNVLEVEIPTFSELNGGDPESRVVTYAAYVLSGEAIYKNKSVDTKDWNLRVNAEAVKPQVQTIADAKATRKEGETVITYGYVYGYYAYDANHFYTGVYIASGADGMMLYAGKLTNYFGIIDIGDLVMVIGKAAPYNGLFEVKPDAVKEIDHAIEGVTQPTCTTYTVPQVKALSSTKAGDFVKLENLTMVSNIADKNSYKKGEHWTLKAKDANNNEVTIYVNYHVKNAVMEEIRQLFIDNAGKTFNIVGTLSWYNAPQICPIVSEINKTAAMSFTFNG
jgi:hypothetical protein